MARLNWVGIPGRPEPGVCLKTPCRSVVECDWYADMLHQALDQQEVAVGVLLLAEEGVDHRTGGIVHRDQQSERRRLAPQPRVMTAVHLDQHAFPGHALAAYPVLGRTPAPRTAQSGARQDAPQGGPADVDALALAQQLAEMRVVGPCVSGTSQVNHGSCNGLGCCVGWPAATMTVSDGGNALLSISRQDAPGVASGDTHERRCLVQGHVLSEQTVQNLESCLFFLSQCHILHKGSVTFMLAS